mmetsp:Transcript_6300/g.4741  ORF Transcript_6300/g.4741 Transcript_6300/m.4741 type:complete len:120 (+) Transcript_6300:321-680(+)
MHNDVQNAVILIFANKMDLPTAKNAAQISDAFCLHEIKHHEWHIQSCCALTGEGLSEGLDWLTNKLVSKNKIHKTSDIMNQGPPKNITKLPDRDNKPKLTDLTMGEREDTHVIGASNRS